MQWHAFPFGLIRIGLSNSSHRHRYPALILFPKLAMSGVFFRITPSIFPMCGILNSTFPSDPVTPAAVSTRLGPGPVLFAPKSAAVFLLIMSSSAAESKRKIAPRARAMDSSMTSFFRICLLAFFRPSNREVVHRIAELLH